jgi:hypothetical protein
LNPGFVPQTAHLVISFAAALKFSTLALTASRFSKS